MNTDPELEYMFTNSKRFFPSWNPSSGNQVTGLMDLLFFVYNENPNAETWCEIGSLLGESALLIASCPFVKKLYCIDPFWKDHQYNQFLKRTKHIGSKIELMRSTSEKAYEKFEKNSVDVVYIDGDHSYGVVKKDLDFAINVVKDNGFICGHDYADPFPEVRKAVDEFLLKYKFDFFKFQDCSFLIKKK